MSTTAVRTEPPAHATPVEWSLPARLMAGFSGSVGLAVKLAFLAIVNALAVWAAFVLAVDGRWVALVVLAAATVVLDLIYLSRRAIPAKFLVPGTIFLLAFQAIPVAYTFKVAFDEYSTGHILTKGEAIEGIERAYLAPPPDGRSYLMLPARDAGGALVLLLVDEVSGDPFVGTREGLEPLPADAVERDEFGEILSAEGYRLVPPDQLLGLDRTLSEYLIPTEGAAAIRPEGLDAALELRPTLAYDREEVVFRRATDGKVFRDNGHGSFAAADGEELEPGWRTTVGFENFSALVNDPIVRKPFFRVFVWTFVFAALTVFVSFAIGLLLAILLDKPGLRFSKVYRALVFVPFAIPGFLSLLVWGGLLNDDFGVVNGILPVDVPWLFDPWWARVSVIMVGVWMTVPYFFLVSLGALQSIPNDIVEAARVDGAGPLQVFRAITLPLLLVAVAPLLIASYAFNFNDFGKIYLLTAGGPAEADQEIAGTTDILISYTYKLAFESGKGQDFGLASAVSIVIFLIVGSISAVSFWRSRSLEEMR